MKKEKEYKIVRISKRAYNKLMKQAKKAKRTFLSQLDVLLKV